MRLIKMGEFTRGREETNIVIIQEIHKARAKTKTHGGKRSRNSKMEVVEFDILEQ